MAKNFDVLRAQLDERREGTSVCEHCHGMGILCERHGGPWDSADSDLDGLGCPDECGAPGIPCWCSHYGPPYPEVIVQLANGNSLRSGHSTGEFTSGDYVRLCGPDGEEILYWSSDEWATDPVLVMGAIINSAAGLHIEDN